jgi:tetratricopeptide (TPR) repeat protein
MLWPVKLAVIYPYAWADLPRWRPALAAVLLAAVTIGAILARRRRPVFVVGWGWYLVALLPVIGFIQVGSQSMADRYTHIPGIGIALLIAWGLGEIAGRGPKTRTAILVAVPLVLAALGVATRAQVVRWRTSETLFAHTVQVTRNNFAALSLLGLALWEQGRMDEGNVYIKASIEANPLNRAMVFRSAGDHFAGRGMAREAAEQYRKALEIRPYDRYVQEKLRTLGAAAIPPAP